MNKNRIWLVIPTACLPYFLLCTLSVVFFSTQHPLCRFIMERVFAGNGLLLIASVLIFTFLAASMSVICFFISIRKQWDALSLAKTAMIIKLLQIPAYVIIFIMGVILLTTILAIPISFVLFLVECLTLVLTGLFTTAAAVVAVRKQMVTWKECGLLVGLQLVFCADVVASILLYSILKKRTSSEV